ncbi:MAG: AraC family transcriptional regulator [Chloroflexota bacterium]
MTDHSDKLEELLSLTERQMDDDGIHKTSIKDVGIFRASTPGAQNHEQYEPSVLIVAQGTKRCHVGDKTYEYGRGKLLMVFMPMPVQTEILAATPDQPFLAVGMRLDMARLAEMLLRIEQAEGAHTHPVSTEPTGIFAADVSEKLLDPFIRLMETLDNPTDAAILGPQIVDEIYYRLLSTQRGGDLRTFLQQRGQMQRISKAVQHIQQNVAEPVSVEKLAEMVNMSRTSFHENFKEIMHVSPLQYAKSVKLMKAQALLREGKNASEAGYSVGYNSPAQFSREYKRHFGYVPSAT